MLNIVIPMAGRGSRFAAQGYALPKPLIEVLGQPMIRLVIQNLKVAVPHRFIFLCLDEHLASYGLREKLLAWAPGCEIVSVRGVTEGAACTVLLAKDLINTEEPLMIANSDQWVDFSLDRYLAAMDDPALQGLIMTMTARDPKWSFVRLNERREIIEVVEKQQVSSEATVGIYNYRRGRDFVRAAERMIANNFRVNNEFYVAPVYNEIIKEGGKIGFVNIGRDLDGMYGLGTPEDLKRFAALPVARKAVSFDL